MTIRSPAACSHVKQFCFRRNVFFQLPDAKLRRYLSFFVEDSEESPVDTEEMTAKINEELDALRNFMDVGEGTVMV